MTCLVIQVCAIYPLHFCSNCYGPLYLRQNYYQYIFRFGAKGWEQNVHDSFVVVVQLLL